ncbi:hypothetical protein JL721_21 [Aureococcus anophagefferens]|nr:hypothetical protein JL721_21 [Aureococcus anophagefferens]
MDGQAKPVGSVESMDIGGIVRCCTSPRVMESVQGSLQDVARCVAQQNGAQLAALLGVLDRRPLPPSVQGFCASAEREGRVDDAAYDLVGERWGPIAAKQLCARAALAAGDVDRAYACLVGGYNALINAMREEAGWRARARGPGRRGGRRGDGERWRYDTLRDVEKTLKKGFSACWNDRGGGAPGSLESKKRATLYVVAQLLKIYFKLNLLKLAQPLIRPLEATAGRSGAFDSRKIFPQGDVVAYRFFVGRLRMFEDQYGAAEEHLIYALAHCDASSRRNKRAILEFLLPVRLRRGALPRRALLEKHGLAALAPLVDAVRSGDLGTFNAELAKNQMAFVRRGTFLLLEKVKILVYRNLFKKIYLVQGKATQLKLHLFQRAFAWLGCPTDMDEIECILANLIFKGLIKGYISHQKQTLVLSKKDPFPTAAIRSATL